MTTRLEAQVMAAAIVDLARRTPIGGLLTFDQLQDVTGRDLRGTRRTVIYNASDELRDDGLALRAERGSGYRVVRVDRVEAQSAADVERRHEPRLAALEAEVRRLTAALRAVQGAYVELDGRARKADAALRALARHPSMATRAMGRTLR